MKSYAVNLMNGRMRRFGVTSQLRYGTWAVDDVVGAKGSTMCWIGKMAILGRFKSCKLMLCSDWFPYFHNGIGMSLGTGRISSNQCTLHVFLESIPMKRSVRVSLDIWLKNPKDRTAVSSSLTEHSPCLLLSVRMGCLGRLGLSKVEVL